MGMWGNKIGDSDQALNVFDTACRDELYLKALIERNDLAYYLNAEETLCAIAIVDVSVNGNIDKRIWSNYVLNDKECMDLLNTVAHYWSARWELVKPALNVLNLIADIDLPHEKEREEIFEILGTNLQNAVNDMNNFIAERRG